MERSIIVFLLLGSLVALCVPSTTILLAAVPSGPPSTQASSPARPGENDDFHAVLQPMPATANRPARESLDLAQLRNPVWTSKDNLRDPSVLKTADGYRIFYSRLAGDWADPKNWIIGSAFTKDFVHYEDQHDVSPTGHASPGDVVRWHGRWLLPYQSYPAKPTRLVVSESADLKTWSAPKPFLVEAMDLPWNDARRVIDPTFVVEGDTLHCFFVGTTMKPSKANLIGHAVTRDPKLQRWEILTKDAPLLGRSERAPDGCENVMVYRTGDHWTMLFSEGLRKQHLAWAASADLRSWAVGGEVAVQRQEWMAVKYGAPFVWPEGDGWAMILMGQNRQDRTTFGLLTSPDGLHWACLPEKAAEGAKQQVTPTFAPSPGRSLRSLPSVNATAVSGEFVPDFRVRPDDYTVLMAADAKRPPELKTFQPGAHGKFHVTGWTQPEQALEWEITVPEEGAYSINVLLRRDGSQALRVEVAGARQALSGLVPTSTRGWTRLTLDGLLRLPAGKQKLVLRARSSNDTKRFNVSIFSIELVRPAVRERLHAAAIELRADTRWLQECRYGLMCHWTSQTMPRRGERKPYEQAVREFDVEAFAEQVQQTGAGFVVFTTSHAQHFFPAPLQSLDRILPGRTARRDLVVDLADALGRRRVKLFLYYHLGASSDPAWLKATGFWETDTSRLFNNWTAMISEAGQRYGDKLAGWWFDDGAISYYYRSAPWEQLATAAKAGHARRLVAFNPWELPSPTEFQDYFCGEGNVDPGMGGLVPIGGNGRISGGPHQGLQACATLITEQDWVHGRKDSDIGPPTWDAQQLTALLKEFISRKNVPIFNLEIYQEGVLSPKSVALFRQAASHLPPRR